LEDHELRLNQNEKF